MHGGGQGIQAAHLMPGRLQGLQHVGPNEPGRAGDENSHVIEPTTRPVRTMRSATSRHSSVSRNGGDNRQVTNTVRTMTAPIDVILPCLNEAESLPGLLEAMPAGYRPIVADNGSIDGSGVIAASYGATVVDVPQRGF